MMIIDYLFCSISSLDLIQFKSLCVILSSIPY